MRSNYVAAWSNWDTGLIEVVERDIDSGERFVTRHVPLYYFYVPDENGEHLSIFGDRVTKLEFGTRDEFEAAKQKYPVKFESDIAPLARVLMDKYYGRDTPPTTFALFDIEVDYAKALGFSSPMNPYAPINAVTVFQSWTKQYFSIVVPPLVPHPSGVGTIKLTEMPGWSNEKFMTLIHQVWKEHNLGFTPNISIVDNESALLSELCRYIEEADIISGWNSEFFDLPYVCERMNLVFGPNGAQGIDYASCRKPEKKMVTRFGSEAMIYKLFGRSHLDYLELFKKFTFEGRESYSLANIADAELDIPKLEHEGTLEELYHGTHRPNVDGVTWHDTLQIPNKLNQLNAQRELIRQEIQRRK